MQERGRAGFGAALSAFWLGGGLVVRQGAGPSAAHAALTPNVWAAAQAAVARSSPAVAGAAAQVQAVSREALLRLRPEVPRYSAARGGDFGDVWALDALGQASLLLERRLRSAGPLRREFDGAAAFVLRFKLDVELDDAFLLEWCPGLVADLRRAGVDEATTLEVLLEALLDEVDDLKDDLSEPG
jgi:hypothetical protein